MTKKSLKEMKVTIYTNNNNVHFLSLLRMKIEHTEKNCISLVRIIFNSRVRIILKRTLYQFSNVPK